MLTVVQGIRFTSGIEPVIRRLIPDADRRAIAFAEAIRSLPHLVPAPDTTPLMKTIVKPFR